VKSSVFNLIFTVFLLWLTIQLQSSFEDYLAYAFILTVGIIHGANDISLIGLLTQNSSKKTSHFLLLYLALIIVTGVTFFKLPLLALLIFIGFSCYHFGEQHFCNQLVTSGLRSNLLYFSYGMLVFGLLFYLNYEATASIILELTGVALSEVTFLLFLVFGMICTLGFVFFNRNNFASNLDYFKEVFLILLFAIIFKLASLLWAFAIYFVIWHSLPSLRDQTYALYGNLSKSSLVGYIKSSLLNWLLSIFGLGIVYYFSTVFNIRFITLFFAFLAAITIPHVIVMHYLNKK